MADKDLTQGQSLLPSDKTRYVDLGADVYALLEAVRLIGEHSELTQDEITGALVSMAVAHHEIHEGETWLVSYKSPDAANIADNGTITFTITVNAKWAHMLFRAPCGGDMEAELREGATIQGGTGTAMVRYNKNRGKTAEDSTVTVRRDATITGAGTLIENEFIPGGTGPQAVGGAGVSRAEWILNRNTTYLVRVTNRAGNAQPMSLAIEWYEEGSNA